MAIEKMNFVSIAGPIESLEKLMLNSINDLDIQLVDVVSVLEEDLEVKTFTDLNPYDPLLKKMDELFGYMQYHVECSESMENCIISFDSVEKEVRRYDHEISELHSKMLDLKNKLSEKEQIKKQIIPIQNLMIEVDKLFNFKFIKFRFGKMPKENYEKVETFLANSAVLPLNVSAEGEVMYLIYFTPSVFSEEIDQAFKSLNFERMRISDEVQGYPKDALNQVNGIIDKLKNEIKKAEQELTDYFKDNSEGLNKHYAFLYRVNKVFEAQKYLVQSKTAFFIAGWIPDVSIGKMEQTLEPYQGVSYTMENPEEVKKVIPPTKLRNHTLLKPFEDIVLMYGVPSYKELDPTILVAITYILMFGIMFGDLGQGLVIAAIGWYLFNKKGVKLGKIMTYLGSISAITGVFYGSLFGNEEILRELLPFIPMINPMEKMNLVLEEAIGFGVVLLLVAMILNMINLYKDKKFGKLLFDRNGIAGFIFYVSCLSMGLWAFTNHSLSPILIVLLTITPLLFIFFSHPLENIVNKEKHIFPEDKAGFVVETSFEILETVLAFLSNTLSFIRVGAFALNHVGFFMAFHMLADMVGGASSIFVMIFGNILIIVLEGMVVGIQGLRLEYYELFSRFFNGEGITFKPFSTNK